MDHTVVQALGTRIRENIQRVIVGKDDVINLMFTAILAKGHILLEDVPGTGKTMLVKAMARTLDCRFSRVQCTPDLLPSDITGLSIYNQKTQEFEYKPGPVHTHLLLADEINRATPRTQAALLEAMEERQVTVDGTTRVLEEPFLVMATQNPVESQGTFPLPEAQLDRFLFKVSMGYPDTNGSLAILERFIQNDPLAQLSSAATRQEIIEARAFIPAVHVSKPVQEYMVRLVESTRTHESILLGISPRGLLGLLRASQALAAIRGRDFVTPDDVQTLAVPVFAHRLIARGAFQKTGESQRIVNELVAGLLPPTEAATR